MTPHNKFGVHYVVQGSHDWYGTELERSAAVGQPFALVKSVFDEGALGQALSVSDKTCTIYRVSIDDDRDFPATEDGSWFWRSSSDCLASALDWMHKCDVLWHPKRPKVRYFELVNEPNPTDKQIPWFLEWSQHCLDEADRLGYKLAWGSFSTGCPTAEQMGTMLPFVAELARRGHILAMHDGAVVEPFTFQGTATDVSKSIINSSLRYRWWKNLADKAGLPFPNVAITEGYAYGTKSPAFYEDWKWYLTELAKDDYLIGVAWYTLGDGGQFGNIAGKPMQTVVTKSLDIDYAAIEPTPEPLPPVSLPILKVRYTSQITPETFNACGPACAAMLELYQFDVQRNAETWWKATGASPTSPVTFTQMERAANSFGRHFNISVGHTMAELDALLALGIAPILLVNAGYLDNCATTAAHFVIPVGKTESGKYLVHDPYRVGGKGGALVLQSRLDEAWHKCNLQSNPNGAWLILENAVVVPPVPPPSTSTVLNGLGMADLATLTSPDLDCLRIAKVKAFKVLTLQHPPDNATLIDQIRSVDPNMFIVARLMFPPDSENRTRFSPQDFVNYVREPALTLYAKGVLYQEIHNEVNLEIEGWKWNWKDGVEFGNWFNEVCLILRRDMPNAKFGFPGLSPQENNQPWCEASDQFLNEAAFAASAADWIGCHSYYMSDGTGYWQMQNETGGWYYRKIQRKFIL